MFCVKDLRMWDLGFGFWEKGLGGTGQAHTVVRFSVSCLGFAASAAKS